ncbi:hypothetical protein D7X33_34880 [Butyricicoccus sp. 1XD8-22]|nr:hypothetical protein D7X33_34880 [Butyricicoccus sp. 1XD8-22]
MKMTADRLLDIIQCFYINKTLTEEEQEMINDLIEVASDYLEMTEHNQFEVNKEYKKAIITVIRSEPQGEEDEAMHLSSIKSYLQGVLEGKW